MLKIFHRFMRLVVAIILIVSLAGCIKGRMDVQINSNGSADLHYRILAKGLNLLKENPMLKLENEAKQAGFKITRIAHGGYEGFRARKHLDSLRQLPNFKKNIFRSGNGNICLVHKGFFITAYRFKTSINFRKLTHLSNEDLALLAMKHLQMAFRLTMPGQVVDTNAVRVLGDNRTLEWNLVAGKNQIWAESEELQWANIIYCCITGILMIFLGYFLYFAWKKIGVYGKTNINGRE